MTIWKSWIPCILVVIVLSACCGQQSMFVLLPDPDGKVGVITVSTPEGSVDITRASEATVVSGKGVKPSPPKKISQEQINADFGEALAVLPDQPEHFILYFLSQSTELTADSLQVLPAIMESISKRGSQNISVVGHADRAGNVQYNLKISTERAKAITGILIEKGISSSYVSTTSHGEGNPLIKTEDGVQEPKNRRVEVVVK
jgi:outer membrane protein OmpA-like peptidoglycan-associated protein